MHNFNKFDIISVNLGKHKDNIQGGVRPCIIVGNDIGNLFAPILLICPLTSVYKPNMETTRVYLGSNFGLQEESYFMGEQVHSINKSQVNFKIGHVGNWDIQNQINNTLLTVFGIDKRDL